MSTEVTLFGRATGFKGYSWKNLSIEFYYPEVGPVPENSWIVIRNLPRKFSTNDILGLVNPYGYLEVLKRNNKTTAFVRMASVDDCARAIEGLDTMVFEGRWLKVGHLQPIAADREFAQAVCDWTI